MYISCFARPSPFSRVAHLTVDGGDVVAEVSDGKVFTGEAGIDDIEVLNQVTPLASYVALDGSFVQDRPVVVYDNQVIDGLNNAKITVANNIPAVEGGAFFGIWGQYSTPHNNPNQNYNITIKNLELDGNAANQSIECYGIFFKHASNVLVDNCNIHDWKRSGVSPVYGCGKFEITKSVFSNNIVAGATNNSPMSVLDCDFYTKGGIYFEGAASSNSIAADNRFHSCSSGISSTVDSIGHLVERNTFNAPTFQVMTLYGSEIDDNILNVPGGQIAGIYADNCILRRNVIDNYYIAAKLITSEFYNNEILNANYALLTCAGSTITDNTINASFRKTYLSGGGNVFRTNTFSGNGTFSNDPTDIFEGNIGAPDT